MFFKARERSERRKFCRYFRARAGFRLRIGITPRGTWIRGAWEAAGAGDWGLGRLEAGDWGSSQQNKKTALRGRSSRWDCPPRGAAALTNLRVDRGEKRDRGSSAHGHLSYEALSLGCMGDPVGAGVNISS